MPPAGPPAVFGGAAGNSAGGYYSHSGRHVRRILANVLSAISLLLFAATVVLWVRSYIVWDYIARYRVTSTSFISREGGMAVHVIYWGGYVDAPPNSGWDYIRYPAIMEPVSERRANGETQQLRSLGFVIITGTPTPPSGGRSGIAAPSWSIRVPYWFLLLVTGSLPSIRMLRSVIRTFRRTRGHCVLCGYDLRATPDHCPECGAVPDRANPAEARPA